MPESDLARPFQTLSPAELAAELGHLPNFVFLDSASGEEGSGRGRSDRFSLLTACPRQIFTGNLFHEGDFARLTAHYRQHQKPSPNALLPGSPGAGLYGWISYEGDFAFGEYDEVLVYDHQRKVWHEEGTLSSHRRKPERPESAGILAPFHDEMSERQYCDLVKKAQDHIAAGDIYQVNLSHRFSTPVPPSFSAYSLYEHLREKSPAPFGCFLRLGGRTAISSSPEQFLRISGRNIQTRPIKGTRPRFRDRARDEKSADDLLHSPKEIAELVMITDLERNDLGQICEFGTVIASELLQLERYSQVFHLVSTIEGVLRAEVGPLEAIRACFPGGSITGAPKKRAREIIRQLEPCPRGLYTGAIGCLGYNGESRFNIAIRTLVEENGELHFHVGAGIVADSVPETEWEETLHKASGMLQACEAYGA
ncbi:MAG: aminodeoxychorismate synthase component I [Verrucomicrobiales bacterium]|nr:aminodeoxychorismate synthase component I [Verrucomicrobiales bacterium]